MHVIKIHYSTSIQPVIWKYSICDLLFALKNVHSENIDPCLPTDGLIKGTSRQGGSCRKNEGSMEVHCDVIVDDAKSTMASGCR